MAIGISQSSQTSLSNSAPPLMAEQTMDTKASFDTFNKGERRELKRRGASNSAPSVHQNMLSNAIFQDPLRSEMVAQ